MNFKVFYLLLLSPFFLTAQSTSYKVYDTENQKEITLEELVVAVAETNVLFFGEEHDDSIGHALQSQIYALLLEQYSTVALSMEMFETDGQLIVEEYLAGHISEDKMTNDARAWGNYKTDYRPMVELAKEKGKSVIAANAPRRYVSLISKKGLSALESLPKASKKYLAPLPIATDDEAYYKRFEEIMGDAIHGMGMNIYHAQCAWDATMAYSVFKYWKKHKKELIFHLNGRFHTDYQQGTVTQLRRLNKNIKIKNISCFSVSNFETPNWSEYSDLGSFLIVSAEN